VSRPEPPSPLDLLRDPRAAVDTGLGPLAFVIANAVAGLHTAAAVAVGVSLVLMVERLVRHRSVVNAIGGLLGTGLCAFIALRTGRPEGYFVPRMLYQAALALAFGGSVLFRRPLAGYLIVALYRAPLQWLEDPRVRRVCSELTLAWALLFALRAAIYAVLIALGQAGWLAAASIVIGWPAFLLLGWACYRYAPKRLDQLGAPRPQPA
jgi:Protein of unknown function (DUF3159)